MTLRLSLALMDYLRMVSERTGTIAELYEGQELTAVLVELLHDNVRCEQAGGRWLIAHEEVERIKALQGPGGRLPRSVSEQ
jgi:hypothetical protein